MSKKPFALWTDQDVCDWFDNLDDDYIRSLIDLHDDHDITPRKAFHYVFGDLDSQHCTCQACKLSLSPAPAQERQSESVAAPAEVGQEQGTSFDLFAHPADQEAINHCPECNRFWVGLPFIAEVDQVMDGLLLSLGVTLSHDVPKFLSDEERQRRINNFFGSDSFQALAKVGNRLFEICAQENISVVDAVIDYVGGHRA